MVKGLEIDDNYDKSGKDNSYTKPQKWVPTSLRKPIPILSLIFLVSLFTLVIVLTVRYFNRNNEKQNIVIEEGANNTLPNGLTIISREEWQARPFGIDLRNPVPYVIIWHTVTQSCNDQASCSFQVRHIQKYHANDRRFADIAFNFLVGGDGNVYEGRGWTKEGTHTLYHNNHSIGIGFLGSFGGQKPPPWQLDACKLLIATGVNEGYIDKNYRLMGALQLRPTDAPGQALFEELQTWPHWYNNSRQN